jgi:hypothetical protein
LQVVVPKDKKLKLSYTFVISLGVCHGPEPNVIEPFTAVIYKCS